MREFIHANANLTMFLLMLVYFAGSLMMFKSERFRRNCGDWATFRDLFGIKLWLEHPWYSVFSVLMFFVMFTVIRPSLEID